jgi:prepilin-type N-terminal cleavage/methylation domain-containing protein
MAGKGATMKKKNGFTLIELLVVIVIIGVLATLVVGGANYAVRVSREKRRMISCNALKTAITRYRTEYNEWPGGSSPTKRDNKEHTFTFEGEDNAQVFGMLRASNKRDNPDGIHFLDETAFFTPDGDGGATKLSETTGSKPLVFITRSGRQYLYFRVVIDFDDDVVTVDTIKNGVDQFYDEDEDEKLD